MDRSTPPGPGIDAGELLALFDLLPASVFTVDAEDLTTTLVSSRGGERLGRPSDVPTDAAAFWAFVPDEERRALLELLRSVAADGIPRALEHRARIEERERWFCTRVRVDARAEGRPRLLGVMLDVTSARHLELQAQEIESWLVALGETLPFDFWICDLSGRCVLQNPVSRRHRGNLLGQAHPEWIQYLPQVLSGEPVREERESEVDGEARHLVRIVSPIRREHGVHGVLGVDLDVTDLKRTEDRLRRSLAELSEAQDSLVRRKQLVAMGEMSALVAHEVRNPLGVISNALAVLRRQAGKDGPGAELCGIIMEEVERLDGLVANLLDSVRPMNATLLPTQLRDVVDEALAQALRASGRSDGIRVHRVVDPALPPIPIDAHLLGMALRNVFQNALQAMPSAGDLFLAIDREQNGEGAWTRVSIRDRGPGLPRDVKDRVFEPFVTTRPTGSGLGLTIVRRVVEEHRGQVELSSEPGRGTTCVLRLPP